MRTLAIVGAALGGAKAAEAARKAEYDGRIVLIGDESEAPYERPPLSKALLRGEADRESTRVHKEGFYARHEIELVTAHVEQLDAATKRLVLADGSDIAFDSAILATGAAPRRLDVDGGQLDGVFYLRTIDDSLRIGEAIKNASRVAVVGTGWIGSEVAASARQMGADVVLIGPDTAPLQRVLGEAMGQVFADLHSSNGVALRLGARVVGFAGSKSVDGVILSDGQIEPADVVVVGVGVTPRTELAEAAGLNVDNGIVVDEYLRTSAPDVFAAGDVANAWHPNYRRQLRVEHWDNAIKQGAAAGRNASGDAKPYTRLPYFFSDQYDLGMEYVGLNSPDDSVVVRGGLGSREFIAFWHNDGVVTAAMNVNIWDVVDDLRKVVESQQPVDLEQLADASVALSDLA